MKINPDDFLSPQQVYEMIAKAISDRNPFSLVRIGDGEALALAQQSVLPLTEVKQQKFLQYAGITVPDLKARDELLAAITKATLVGLPNRWDLKYFSPLVEKVLTYYQLRLDQTCDCCINYYLHQAGLLLPLFKGKRTLVIGRRCRELGPVLKNIHQIKVVGQIPVEGYRSIPEVLQKVKEYNFDIAFVSSGIPAVTICVKIANQFAKVALDLGHLADRMIEEYL